MPYLTRDGVRLYYEDHGKDVALLLSHGFGASTAMWHGQVEAFQASYRLIPWDMRGHGNSDSPEDQALYSQQHTVEDMRALLYHLQIEPAVIAGHSLGGFMSLAFHVASPQRVKALILQGCGPGYRNAEARATWNARAEQRARTLETQGLAALGLAKAARGILAQVDARVIDNLPHIRVPTLIIVGERDTPFADGSHYMAARIPQATEVVVSNAGHGANVEQPEVVNASIRQFLARL